MKGIDRLQEFVDQNIASLGARARNRMSFADDDDSSAPTWKKPTEMTKVELDMFLEEIEDSGRMSTLMALRKVVDQIELDERNKKSGLGGVLRRMVSR